MKFFVKIAVSILILVLILYLVELEKIMESFSRVEYSIILLSIFLSHIDWLVASWKLHLIAKIPFSSVLRLHYISMLYSFILPGQLAGEGYKLVKISKESGYAKGTSVILVDRFTGFLAIVFLAIVGLLFSSIEISAQFYAILFTLGFVFITPILFIQTFQNCFLWLSRQNLSLLSLHSPKIVRLLEEWKNLQNQKLLFWGNLFLGIAFQFIAIFINYMVGISLGIHVSLFDWFWIFGLISLALFLPITYAGLGIREGSMIGLLGLFSVEAEKALALSFLILGFQLTGVVVGFILNWRKK